VNNWSLWRFYYSGGTLPVVFKGKARIDLFFAAQKINISRKNVPYRTNERYFWVDRVNHHYGQKNNILA